MSWSCPQCGAMNFPSWRGSDGCECCGYTGFKTVTGTTGIEAHIYAPQDDDDWPKEIETLETNPKGETKWKKRKRLS